MPRRWEGGWIAAEEFVLKGGHTALLFVCRASWSRSAIIYMAVNLTSTGGCLVRVILRITTKLIELWLTFKTLQCCRDANVFWVRRLPQQISKRVQELSPVVTLTGDCLRGAPTPYRLWRPQSVSSHRTCACDTIRHDGWYTFNTAGFLPFFWRQFSTRYSQSCPSDLGCSLFHC